MTSERAKIIAVVGPTASGKSDLAVEIARKYGGEPPHQSMNGGSAAHVIQSNDWCGGEIISADSRQVYRGLDIGTGKITKKEMRGIPHHLLDIADPNEAFSAAQFKKEAEEIIGGILSRENLPIIAGGTGFYIQALIDNISLPEVPPDKALRAELEKKSAGELFEELKTLDLMRAKTIERENPRRLIRAIEIARALGSVPKQQEENKKYEVLQVGLWPDNETLRTKIERRNMRMLEGGLIDEVGALRARGISDERMQEFGFEYALPLEYLKGNLTKKELLKKMNEKTWQYAKRQRAWFKRDKRIHWLKNKNPAEQSKKAARLVAIFLNN